MADGTYIDFLQNLRWKGYVYAPTQGTKLYKIAKKCSLTIGLASGGGGAVAKQELGKLMQP